MDLSRKKILVTGGAGFLGSHVVEALERLGGQAGLVSRDGKVPAGANVVIPRSTQFDLSREDQVRDLYETVRPEVVIHLAAVCGGIGINRLKPGTFYYKNLMMGALTIEYARIHGVEKFVAISTICAYPKLTPVPFAEDDLWNGYPEETNAPYGIAKKVMQVQGDAYRQEFGLNSIYLLPVNLYGPRDNFDPVSSHVIPALIRKCVEAKKAGVAEFEVWGTGRATREFLFVEDAAQAIVMATEQYEGLRPVNLGAGFEISIKDLVQLIVELVGYRGEVRWNTSYPDGQPRRMLDCSRAKAEFGFEARTTFRDGLKKTIDWYERQEVPAT
ncbi:MAG: GDP-L-fucose synthase [Isosphaeraceae bacterium]